MNCRLAPAFRVLVPMPTVSIAGRSYSKKNETREGLRERKTADRRYLVARTWIAAGPVSVEPGCRTSDISPAEQDVESSMFCCSTIEPPALLEKAKGLAHE